MSASSSALPLHGIKVVEFAGLAPGPFAGVILADWGASVVRVDKPDQSSTLDILSRAKRSIAVDPRNASGLETLKRLINQADVLIDPFRPGVMERLGLGPDNFLDAQSGTNRRLIFARVHGFAPQGPQANMAGHDLNYLAQSGILPLLPPSNSSGKPSFPVNILADFAGGGLMCALGILLAIIERQRSNLGQVVNTNMVDGARYVSSFPLIHASFRQTPYFSQPPGENLLDGGAPFYDVYQCQDGRWMSVACLEPQFFAAFVRILNSAVPNNWIPPTNGYTPSAASQLDKREWPELRLYIESAFKSRPRDDWAEAFHGSDACATPVLSVAEASNANHSSVPNIHPLLGRTPARVFDSNPQEEFLRPGEHTLEILNELGLSSQELRDLEGSGALGKQALVKAKM